MGAVGVAGASMGTMGTGGGMAPQPFDLHTVLTGWQNGPFAWLVLTTLVGAGAWYAGAMRRLRGKGRRWPLRRGFAFGGGLLAVELAVGSAVATLAGSIFSAHIVQHLLLMVVAPPMLALGAPSTLLLQTSEHALKRRWLRVLHSRPFAVVTHPVVVWFMYYGSMFAFFLSPLLGDAMRHPAIMDLWNMGFFFGAACFWWPMVGLDPIPRWRMGYGLRFVNLLIGVPFESFLGIALLMQRSPAAPMYTVSGTHTGGGLLWAATEIFTVAAMVPIFIQWSNADLREGRRIDRRLAAQAAGTAQPLEPAQPFEPAEPLEQVAAGGSAARPQTGPPRTRGLGATFASLRRDYEG